MLSKQQEYTGSFFGCRVPLLWQINHLKRRVERGGCSEGRVPGDRTWRHLPERGMAITLGVHHADDSTNSNGAHFFSPPPPPPPQQWHALACIEGDRIHTGPSTINFRMRAMNINRVSLSHTIDLRYLYQGLKQKQHVGEKKEKISIIDTHQKASGNSNQWD